MSTRHTLREYALFAAVLVAAGLTGSLIARVEISLGAWVGI